MIEIRQATMPEDRHAIQDLFAEYLGWVCPRIYEEYRVIFNAQEVFAHDMDTLDVFMPPQGLLFLAFNKNAPAGCACVRTLADGVQEIKRTYVRPAFRGKGIGRQLVQAAVDAAGQSKARVLRLDSAGFMTDAHALYRSFGFKDRSPYDGSEIPPEYQQHWVFMELDLTGRRAPITP